jgi:uncharacterized membrane protein YsdA (DUF1294 family)/cold shock CspA family protein
MAADEKRNARKAPPMQKGTLVMWNDQKGFGFIRPDGTEEDFFVHISQFKKGMSRRPEMGDVVHFRPNEDAGKKRASFALVESLDQEDAAPRRFELNPRQRSWLINLLIITPLVLSGYLLLMAKNPIPFFSYMIMSILTMILYGTDKANAATRKWRIPESYFHMLELMGGWPGALMAQNQFRHKTRLSTYLYVLRGIIAIHLLAWAAFFYWTSK